MIGIIDGDGWLHIGRAGYEKDQLCPFGYAGEIRCGDWCPHFDEPRESDNGEIVIQICHGKRLLFREKDFSDER